MKIYVITNKKNQKQYVGVLIKRKALKKVLEELADNPHTNTTLREDLNKQPFRDFNIRVVFESNSLLDIAFTEKLYIKSFDTLEPNGYNIHPHLMEDICTIKQKD